MKEFSRDRKVLMVERQRLRTDMTTGEYVMKLNDGTEKKFLEVELSLDRAGFDIIYKGERVFIPFVEKLEND